MNYFKSVTILLLLAGITSVTFSQDVEHLFAVESQPVEQRKIEELKKDGEVNLSVFDVYKPTYLSVNDRDELALYDFGIDRIVYFSGFGADPDFFGRGIGGGPEEFKNPRGLIIKENEIWLSDHSQARITKWSTEGEVIATFSSKPVTPGKIAVDDNGYTLLAFPLRMDGIFFRFDQKGNFLNSFQEPVEDKFEMFYYTGRIVGGSGWMVYASSADGILTKYDLNTGEFIWARATIDEVPLVTVNKRREGNIVYTNPDPESREATLDLEVTNKTIFLLFSGSRKRAARTIDLYDLATGTYQKTLQTERYAKNFAIVDNTLYTLEKNDDTGDYYLAKYTL